jgi:RNAse (barnase) inhibitor barstar
MSGQDEPGHVSATTPVMVMDITPEAATALQRLAVSLGLDAVRVDLSGCGDKTELLSRVADALDFPAWFGGNWDAFFDCLTDLSWRPAAGYVLILEHTDDLRRDAPESLDTALAILADTADAWRTRGRTFRACVAA